MRTRRPAPLDRTSCRWGSRALHLVLKVALTVGATGLLALAQPAAAGASGAPVKSPGPTAGCGHGAPSGSRSLRLSIGSHRRLVIVHVPSHYSGKTPVALVLNMHGSGSTARQQEALSGMDSTADQDRFIVAYPQGLIASGAGFDWNVPGEPLVGGAYPPADAADDVAFLTALVPSLAANYCIDRHLVFATGLSGGARMASQLACDSSRTFSAVAPVAGLRSPSPCPASRAVPVVAFHGTADPIDPYSGNGQGYWTYSVPTAAQRWATHDRCRPTPQRTGGAGYKLTGYSHCADGAAVELYSLTGEGHEWPGGPTLPPAITKTLGSQTQAIDANTAMWAFFMAHHLP